MEKITSFTIDHLRLIPGLYVSRVDFVEGHPITTFDIRITNPNEEPVMNITRTSHNRTSCRHIFTQSSNCRPKDNLFWTNGMPHRLYLLLSGSLTSREIIPLMTELFMFIAEFEGDVPGASAKDCGNYLDMNLPMAKYIARKYLTEVLTDIDDSQLFYPTND